MMAAQRTSPMARLFSRRTAIWLNVTLQVALAVLLVICVNAIFGLTPQTQAWQVDCTQAGRHSISSKTAGYLETLDQPVMLTVIEGQGVAKYGQQRDEQVFVGDRVRDLLGLYDAASPLVHVRVLNADRQKAELLQLESEVNGVLLADSVLLRCGERSELLPFATMVKPPVDPNAIH
jgi:hypothetical protein